MRRSTSTDLIYSFYMVESTGEPGARIIFQTDDEDVVVETVKNLLETIPRRQIKIIKDIDYEIDILLGGII